MKPALLLSAIAGGMAGIFTFSLFDIGLVAPASPGSIFALLAMTPKGNYLGLIAGVLAATAVSFFVSALILKTSKETDSLEEAQMKSKNLKVTTSDINQGTIDTLARVETIVFACDAGMGSSAMGASVLRKKIKEAGLEIKVINKAIAQLPESADIVITHQDLTPRAKEKNQTAYHISVDNFLGSPKYDELVADLLQARG